MKKEKKKKEKSFLSLREKMLAKTIYPLISKVIDTCYLVYAEQIDTEYCISAEDYANLVLSKLKGES